MVLEDLFAPSFFYRPPIFLPVRIRFYPSKWRVDGSLHKAMWLVHTLLFVILLIVDSLLLMQHAYL